MSQYTKKLELIKNSPTVAIAHQVRKLQDQGEDVINLGIGELVVQTPQHICQGAIDAINKGFTRYTPTNGIVALREAIRNKYKQEHNLDYGLDQITVGCGGKQVIFNALLATLNAGDEVIIPAPFWVSYPDMVKLAGGTPKIVSCEDHGSGFKLQPNQLVNAINDKTKWLILNSPNNPSGAVYSKNELHALAEVLLQYPRLRILSDDIYGKIVFDDLNFYNIAAIEPKLKKRVFIANGVSKTYAMTGWRLGFGLGDEELIEKITVVQSQTTFHTASISQYAAIAAFLGPQNFIIENVNMLQKHRDMAIKFLTANTKLSCNIPHGSFYVFFSCKEYVGKRFKDDQDFAMQLLQQAKVAVVPGVAFGMSPYFRLSLGISEKELTEACNRIAKFL